MRHPELHTERLLLRVVREDDASTIMELAGAKEIAETTLSIPHPYPLKAALDWISKYQKEYLEGGSVVFGVTLKETGQFCGTTGLTLIKQDNYGELGFWVGLPYWNRGICTEAARAVMKYGFEELNLHRIFARHFGGNLASGQVMRKIGMKYEGWLREHVRKGDHYEDLVCYGIMRREWEEAGSGNVES